MEYHLNLAKLALSRWNIEGEIMEVTKGYSGAWVFIVTSKKVKYILKRDNSKRKFLHNVLQFLEAQNFPYTSKVISIPFSDCSIYFD